MKPQLNLPFVMLCAIACLVVGFIGIKYSSFFHEGPLGFSENISPMDGIGGFFLGFAAFAGIVVLSALALRSRDSQ